MNFRIAICKYCGKQDLWWSYLHNKWGLYDHKGRKHACLNAYKKPRYSLPLPTYPDDPTGTAQNARHGPARGLAGRLYHMAAEYEPSNFKVTPLMRAIDEFRRIRFQEASAEVTSYKQTLHEYPGTRSLDTSGPEFKFED